MSGFGVYSLWPVRILRKKVVRTLGKTVRSYYSKLMNLEAKRKLRIPCWHWIWIGVTGCYQCSGLGASGISRLRSERLRKFADNHSFHMSALILGGKLMNPLPTGA